MTIPVSVIVAVRNEAERIERCLAALAGFDEIVVVDSESEDDTRALAEAAGATVVAYEWDGAYPKKRQWCLDRLSLRHDWIFFVDADEIVPDDLVHEIAALFECGPPHDGYFVRGWYVIGGRVLRHGLSNNKLVLFNRRRFAFPVVDDLGLPGMGEMEGHYQPVAREGNAVSIGQLRAGMLHEAYGDDEAWERRHRRYAAWEAGMNARQAWPTDPVRWRQRTKRMFRAMPGRPLVAFCHCYFYRRGMLDGRMGWKLAADRYCYYRMVGEGGRLLQGGRSSG
jgi:glycosyltransferase involved in cell wall biosynthesis